MKKIFVKFLIVIMALMMVAFNTIPVGAEFDFDTAVKSAVYIEVDEGSGSGFAIDKHYIMTNAHVIEGTKEIYIGLYDANSDYYNIGEISTAELVCADYDMDIAILYVSDIELVPVRIGDVSKIKVGDDVFAIGAPLGLTFTLTKGIVSAVNRMQNGYKHTQIDATITYGNSGGPLFNSNGEVIGVNSSGYDGENLNFAISIDIAIEYAKKQIPSLNIQNSLPEETKTPAKTEKPSETEASEKTDAPIETEAPEKTEKPVKTEKPEKTKKPTKTAKPSSEKNDSTSVSVLGIGGLIGIAVGALFLIGIAVVVIIVIVMSGKDKNNDEEQFHESNNDAFVPEREEAYQKQEQFVAETSVLQKKPSAKIRIVNGVLGGMEFEIEDGQTLKIGKDASFAHIVIDQTYTAVSRRHLTIQFKNDMFHVTDISSNGTYFASGQRLASNTSVAIVRGTTIKLADDNCQIKLI